MVRIRRCKTCKGGVPKPARGGRMPTYCSPACRQKAYRKRLADPHRIPKRLMQADMDYMAAKTRHVKGLQLLGYEVELRFVGKPVRHKAKLRAVEKPRLTLVATDVPAPPHDPHTPTQSAEDDV